MTNLKELEEKAMEALGFLLEKSQEFHVKFLKKDALEFKENIETYINALKAGTEKVAREAWDASQEFKWPCHQTFINWWEKRKG